MVFFKIKKSWIYFLLQISIILKQVPVKRKLTKPYFFPKQKKSLFPFTFQQRKKCCLEKSQKLWLKAYTNSCKYYKTFSRKDNVELLKTKLLIRQFIKCKTKTTFFCLRTHASFTGWIFYKFFSSRTKIWPKQPTCVASINVLWLTLTQFVQKCMPFCVSFAIEVKGDTIVYKHCLCYSNCGWPLISLGDVKVTISLFLNWKLRWKQFGTNSYHNLENWKRF